MQTSPKDYAETITVTFDFSRETSGAVISPTVDVVVESGSDANPSAIRVGPPQPSGNQVYQQVTAGVPGVKYHLRCTATAADDGSVYVVAGVLPVVRF